MRRLLVLTALLALAGCGDDAAVSGGDRERPQIVVSAASSMKEALTGCAKDFPDATVRLQFAGSDELAAQIRQGVPVDVFAAANTTLPDELAAEGKLQEPVVFATNQLVLAVPAEGATVDSLAALERPGVTLVDRRRGGARRRLHARGARAAGRGPQRGRARQRPLQRTGREGHRRQADPGRRGRRLRLRVRRRGGGGELRAIELPAELEPTATYGAGVVEAAEQPDAAEAFVDDLLAGGCHDALLAAGFGEP